MRSMGLALALGLFSLGAAHAGDLADPVWAKAPDRTEWAKAYPAAAAAAGLSGAVKLRCVATSAGLLQNCAVIEETPAGNGFAAAALSLTAGMELKPTAADGAPVAGRNLIVPVKFDPALLKPPALVTSPDWLRKPTAAETRQYFPAAADGLAGRAVVGCVVTTRGLLENCILRAERPTGHGFGAAAVDMTQLFQMQPMTVDGSPVAGGVVNIPVIFTGGGSQTTQAGTLKLMRTAAWAATPTPADMSASFPRDAIGKVASGHVLLRCSFGQDGRLGFCDTLSEVPAGRGFAAAASSLTKRFRMVADAQLAALDRYGDIRIDIPFDFRDPGASAPPVEVYDPVWLRTVQPEVASRFFPAAATTAGVTQGGATVSCIVAHDGALTGCAVDSEDPKGMGFGDAALRIAGSMAVDPWTPEGTPVDGVHIAVPIRLSAPAAAGAASAPPVK